MVSYKKNHVDRILNMIIKKISKIPRGDQRGGSTFFFKTNYEGGQISIKRLLEVSCDLAANAVQNPKLVLEKSGALVCTYP